MTLIRTKSGLQNLHILKGVEMIVYTEGGEQKTFTKEEVLMGEGHPKSADIRFWRKMFTHHLPNKKVKILSVGSCNTLEQIALDISIGELENVCVAMDRDYSSFWGNHANHRKVVRTRTYSWENEIFQSEIVFRAFEKLVIEDFSEADTRKIIDDSRQTILNQLKHLFRADLVLVAANKSLFCRKQPASCFKHMKRPVAPPEIDCARMRARLRSQRVDIGSFNLVHRPSAAEIDTARDIFGKPLLVASIRVLQHLILKAGQKSMPNDYLEKFLVDAFFVWMAVNPEAEVTKFYADKISVILDAA